MTPKDKLNELRVMHKLTRDDIAVICDVSIETVNNWLYRDVNVPSYAIRIIELELSEVTE